MQHILMAAGWTEYQASCLSPILWALVALAVLSEAAGWYMEHQRRRKIRQQLKARRARDREARRSHWEDEQGGAA